LLNSAFDWLLLAKVLKVCTITVLSEKGLSNGSQEVALWGE